MANMDMLLLIGIVINIILSILLLWRITKIYNYKIGSPMKK